MSTPFTTSPSDSLGEGIFPVSLRGLRAEAELYPLLTTSHGTTRSSCYDDVVVTIYRGWMDDSVIMAGALFAYLWDDYLPREFTSSALRLLFSMESGGAEEEVFQEHGSALRAMLRDYQEWSGAFLRWSREADGEAPMFPWERLSKEMVREGVVAPPAMGAYPSATP